MTHLFLSARDRAYLECLRSNEAAGRMNTARAEAILMGANGTPNAEVARQLSVTERTVVRWRSTFRRSGLGGLIRPSI